MLKLILMPKQVLGRILGILLLQLSEENMKRISIIFGLLFGFMGIALNPVQASDWTGNVNFSLGAKSLDEDDWSPLEEQGELGLEVDFRKQTWPVNISLALLASADQGTVLGVDLTAATSELRFGAKKIWEPTQTMRPFFGGGLSVVSASLDANLLGLKVTDEDSSLGVWFDGGIYWTLNSCFNVGIKAGYSASEVTLFNADTNAGGGHIALMFGYHW